jgi:site-specific DNA-methyltransferase (adenine-specific)
MAKRGGVHPHEECGAIVSTIGDVLSGQAQWCVLEADCSEVLPMLPHLSVDHVITDPPYGVHVHSLQRRVMTGPHRQFARQRGGIGKDLLYHGNPVVQELGFAALSPALRRLTAMLAARVARRWLVIKSDMEGVTDWKTDLQATGARWVRFGVWWKENAQPQLSGDRPGQGTEGFAIAHSRGQRMRWNAGGKHGRWMHAIATDRNRTGERVHTTQTPLPLWLEIVEDFTDPGDLVLDPFCGSGSLGITCVRLGRRYLGMDNGKDAQGKPWAEWAREGIAAEEQGLSRGAARAGQLGLFAV